MKVFVSTADTSGDQHAAGLVRALAQQLRAQGRELDVFGLGGSELEAAGLRPIVPHSDFTVAGLVEVLSSGPRLVSGYTRLRRALREEQPDLVVLVDSPDLNLPLAAVAKRLGHRVLYYVAPQVWAWRSGRVRKLRKRVDHVGVIFPFEEALLREAGVPATFVGHPLVDAIGALRSERKPEEIAAQLSIEAGRPVLGLLPGSRRNEIEHNLPVMLEAAEVLGEVAPDLVTLLLLAPSWRGSVPASLNQVKVIRGRAREAMVCASLLLAAPGTVTVEAALLGVPMVVTHRLNRVSFEIARRVSRVPSSCMVNLIAQRGVVPEYLQEAARPAVLAAALARLLRSPEARDQQIRELEAVSTSLGGGGAAQRAAQLAIELAAER